MRKFLPLWLLALTLLTACALAEEVEFVSGKDKIYGTLELPANATGRLPAVVLISGSGPTDRDGNNKLLTGRVDSHKHFAELLAQHGVASLRYDKVFTGKTGMASHADNPAGVGMDDYVNCADAAFQYLAQRPEIDPQRIAILGHSEGGLIALIVAKEKKPAGLKGLILAMPMSEPYLKTTFDQISAQLKAAGAAGNLPEAEAQAQIGYLRQVVDEIAQTGASPTRVKLLPPLQAVFSPVNDHFLHTCAPYDPAEMVLGLELPILLLSGERDIQITKPMIDHLMTGLSRCKMTQHVALPKTNHVMRVVPAGSNGATDYTDPRYPFSPAGDQAIVDWVKAVL